MYKSQEMPNLRRFLARFWLRDNQMTIRMIYNGNIKFLRRML